MIFECFDFNLLPEFTALNCAAAGAFFTYHMINLDHNATTKPTPGVVRAVERALVELWHNPSSVHRGGQAARHAVELARASLAALVNAKPREIVLASGGTEALDLAIRGRLESLAAARGPGPVATPLNIVTTPVEHHAIRDLCDHLAAGPGASRVEIRLAPVSREGVIDPIALADLIDTNTALVVVQSANNETGTVQPTDLICTLARTKGARLLIDATQTVGKLPFDVRRDPSPDAVVFSPHKFHGPKGVGVLWLAPGFRVVPQVRGTQELGRRGGTENVPGIVGAGVAADEAREWLADPSRRREIAGRRDRFEELVLAGVPGAVVNGPRDPMGTATDSARRLWNTSNIGFPRLEAEALLLLLSERGVAASAGAACSSGSLEPSPVLLAMGIDPEIAHGSLRFSLGRDTTREEVEQAAAIVVECVGVLARSGNVRR